MSNTKIVAALFKSVEDAEAFKALAEEAGATCYVIKPKRKPCVRPAGRQGLHVRPINEQGAGKVVLAKMRTMPMKRWDVDSLAVALEEENYMASTASPTLTRLKQAGYVEHTGIREYRLTALGRGDMEQKVQGAS